MTGSLGHLLYVYANFALGVACNPPYLAHVTLLSAGPAPELLDVCTTTVTYSPDLAVITPAAALAGLLVHRREPLGHLLAAPLLGTIVLMLPTIPLGTALEVAAGISFTPTQVIGPVAGFGVLGAIGTRLLVRPLSAVPTTAPEVLGVHVHA